MTTLIQEPTDRTEQPVLVDRLGDKNIATGLFTGRTIAWAVKPREDG